MKIMKRNIDELPYLLLERDIYIVSVLRILFGDMVLRFYFVYSNYNINKSLKWRDRLFPRGKLYEKFSGGAGDGRWSIWVFTLALWRVGFGPLSQNDRRMLLITVVVVTSYYHHYPQNPGSHLQPYVSGLSDLRLVSPAPRLSTSPNGVMSRITIFSALLDLGPMKLWLRVSRKTGITTIQKWRCTI